jgi:glycyl-tRNA synthetase beta chain
MSLFILEIGTEELPARFQKGLENELITRLSSFLKESNVDFDKVESHVTPRRAAVMVYDIAEVQKESEEVIPGPPVRIAYDADGNPTKAAAGFAKTQGVDLADAFRLETDKGEYLAVRKKMGGAKTADLLAAFCPELIAHLPFAKKMKWGDQEFTFARPIRWLLAMLNDAVVPFTVAELTSGNKTYGHRVHAAGPFAIANAADYFDTIENTCAVVLSAEKRRAKIIEEGNALAEKAGGRIIWKDSLLDEVQGLVEHPIACLGDFDASFLELPRQALLTSMQSHQKSFGVEDAEGNLLPHFLTVLNTTPNEMEVVKVGWERVLRARLEDGRFFWNTDLKVDVDTGLRSSTVLFSLHHLVAWGIKLAVFPACVLILQQRLRQRSKRMQNAQVASARLILYLKWLVNSTAFRALWAAFMLHVKVSPLLLRMQLQNSTCQQVLTPLFHHPCVARWFPWQIKQIRLQAVSVLA